ncbi:MAG: PLP-dependent aminotransferase family protein [Caldisericales bacterium]|nr:PLP-dependent aminotransferase family protein [Caldisericales bacterium]
MLVPLERNGKTSLVQQIKQGITNLIASGDLRKGSRLPSTRDLARTLKVNRNTVVAAYELLSQEGYIVSQVGQGTVIISDHGVETRKNRMSEFFFPWGEKFVRNPQAGVHFQIPHLPQSLGRHYNMINNYPPPELFAEPIIKSIARITRRKGLSTVGFKKVSGFPPLVEEIGRRLSLEGVDMGPRGLVVTPGSSIANTLVFSLLLEEGDTVIVERPTHFAALRWLVWARCRLVEIPMREDGMDLEALKIALQTGKPKLIYTIPSSHNPTGVTTSEAHRKELISIASKYRVPILEDDYQYGLHIGSPKPPLLSALDHSGLVITTSSFSKVIWQGLRLGFVCAPKRVTVQLENLHRILVGPPMFVSQMGLYEYIESGQLDKSINVMKRMLTERQAAFFAAASKHLKQKVKIWKNPAGATVWMETPGILGDEVAARAASMGLLVAPGSFFVPEGTGFQAIRISLMDEDADGISESVSILGKILNSPEKKNSYDSL